MTKGPLLSGHVSLVPVHHVGNWHCIEPSALRAKFASVRALALAAVNELVMMQHVATRRYVAAGNVPVTWQVVGRVMGEGSKRPQHAYCQMVGVPSAFGVQDSETSESGSVSAAATGTHIEDADSRDTKVELVSVRTKFMFKSFAAPRSSETRSRHVTDRIASAFATLVTESGIESLAPVPAVYEFKVTGSHLLGSLTRTLYFVRAKHTVSGLGAAAKINLMGPHAAMLVGDRLLFAGGEVDWSIPRRAIVEGGKLDKTREDWRVVQRTTAAETRERDRWVNGWEDEIERVCRQMEDEKEGMKISEGEVDVGFYSLGGWTREHVIATRKEEHEQESASSGGKSARSMVVDETTGTGAE